MKILKFSSSALNNAENIAKAIQIVKDQYESDNFIVVIRCSPALYLIALNSSGRHLTDKFEYIPAR